MSKRTRSKELPWWRIFRLKATPAADVGRVQAPDAESAIKEAIEKYDIRPEHRDRLMARRSASNDAVRNSE
jgi:1,2-phenylacetyl-CoA epoxidase PaaB subunit